MANSKAPPPRSLAQEGQQALDAQVGLASPTFAAESQWRREYAALDLDALQTTLLGDPDYQRQSTEVQQFSAADLAKRYGYSGYGPYREYAAALNAAQADGWRGDGSLVQGWPSRFQKTTTTSVAAPQRGLLDLYANEIAPAVGRATSAAQSAQRAGDVADVRSLAGATRSAFDALNPEAAQAYRQIQQEDMNQYGLGGQLSPFDQRRIEQGVRSAYTSRGLSLGGGDAQREALSAYLGGEGLRQVRRANALQSTGALQGFYGDPFQQILGRPSTNPQGLLNSSQGQAANAGQGNLFNPFNSYASDVFNTNYNAQASANIAKANNTTALIGAGIGALGRIGGAAI